MKSQNQHPHYGPGLLTRHLCLSAQPRFGSKQVKPKSEHVFIPMSLPLSAPDQPEPPLVLSAIRRELFVEPNTKNNINLVRGDISATSNKASYPVKPGKTKT